jgi:hypothetical protein
MSLGMISPSRYKTLGLGQSNPRWGNSVPQFWFTPDIVIITGVTRHQCLPYLIGGRGVYCPETSSSEDDDDDNNDDYDDNEDDDDDYDDDYLEDDCPE